MPLQMPFHTMMKKDCIKTGSTTPSVLTKGLPSMLMKLCDAALVLMGCARATRALTEAVVFAKFPSKRRRQMNWLEKIAAAVDTVVIVDDWIPAA